MSLGASSWRITGTFPPVPRSLQVRKRRRLKILADLEPQGIVSVKWDRFVHEFSAALVSANWNYLILPAFGFGSGAAGFLLRHRRYRQDEDSSVAIDDEWFLVASPTPFNRSVFLRCPSLRSGDEKSFSGGESEELLCKGRILGTGTDSTQCGDVFYQRFCLSADDGGVISLDWPELLELAGEQELETTVLVVPGTPDGSMDGEVRAFVREALGRGIFPIVMNPRGCARSPIITPRLFSAADSDDVEAAVKFIHKARPWATLMTVAWGYGANMLIKYLAEEGEGTPIAAALCIDNPFDLNRAASSGDLFSSIKEKNLTDGLKEMLRNNKELFKGKTKGFDVARALSATSLREFDAAISMISLGFESIEEFYSKSSTRKLIHRVKVPLLLIQNEDIVQHTSVPQSSILQNPFTSLLIVNSRHSSALKSYGSATIWRQKLAIEWFSSVEVALLKGRHPLQKDIDVTFIPPISVIEQRLLKDSYRIKRGDFYEPGDSKSSSRVSLVGETSEDGQAGVEYRLKDTSIMQGSSLNGQPEERDDDNADGNRGQVRGAASIILNMLDNTMPGTLDAEQKSKILTATESGETFMNALQEAVPEDVRGKLMNAVNDIIQSQGSKINIHALQSTGGAADVQSEIKQNIPSNGTESGSEGEGTFHGNPSVSLSSGSTDDIGDNGCFESMAQDVGDGKSCDPESVISTNAGNDPGANKKDQGKESNIMNDNGDAGKLSTDEESDSQNAPRSDPVVSSVVGLNAQANENSYVQSMIDSNSQNISSGNPSNLFSPGHTTQINGNGNVQSTKKSNLSPVDAPSISVSKTLDALTGFDDSTQMAMNSVFEVIENMIDHLERETEKIDALEPDDAVNETEDNALNNLPLRSSPIPQISGTKGDISYDLSDNQEYKQLDKLPDIKEVPFDLKMNPPSGFSYRNFLPKPVSSKISNAESLDSESTTDLFLDPEEGQWKMLNPMENSESDTNSLQQENQDKDANCDTEINHQSHEGENHEEVATLDTFSRQNSSVVAGAVTAAIGASAFLAHRKKNEAHTSKKTTEFSIGAAEQSAKPLEKLQEASEEKQHGNLVSTLAEKAMAVAAPVVPTTEQGEVDHERLVASLAELGQRGGILRLIGKAALLWGGMRGAMSLTDKLISFLHIAQRPLLQRILGFFCMVLIMWSPVVIPLFPTLVESWRSTTSNGVAEYACIWGLYCAILILVILWGKRIRDYEDPLQQYGLAFTPSSVKLFSKGLFGGIVLVFYVHSINALLGFVSVIWPSVEMPHLSNVPVLLKLYGWTLIKAIQGVTTAACVAAVEELLFRSWLPEEIAADLGLIHAIVISGFLFSLLQRSLASIPGFWFLSLALCGAKQSAQGSLFLPIGIRAGTLVANFAVQSGGLLCYRPNTPIWLASPYPWRPFDGATGLAVCLLMAIYLRPRGLLRTDAKH